MLKNKGDHTNINFQAHNNCTDIFYLTVLDLQLRLCISCFSKKTQRNEGWLILSCDSDDTFFEAFHVKA